MADDDGELAVNPPTRLIFFLQAPASAEKNPAGGQQGAHGEGCTGGQARRGFSIVEVEGPAPRLTDTALWWRLGVKARGAGGGPGGWARSTEEGAALRATVRRQKKENFAIMSLPTHAVPLASAFGKRPPAPRKPKGKPGRSFVGARGGGRGGD